METSTCTMPASDTLIPPCPSKNKLVSDVSCDSAWKELEGTSRPIHKVSAFNLFRSATLCSMLASTVNPMLQTRHI
jgi:hypothetical protein